MNADEVQLTVDEAVALTAAHAKGAAEVGRVVRRMIAARTAEATAPTDAREALAELAERIGRAADSVTTLAASSVSLERVRLEGKAQGLRLAESYTDDATRLAAALASTAPDAGQRDTQGRAEAGPCWRSECRTGCYYPDAQACDLARAGREARP